MSLPLQEEEPRERHFRPQLILVVRRPGTNVAVKQQEPTNKRQAVYRRTSVVVAGIATGLMSVVSIPAGEPRWAVGVVTIGGFGGKGDEKPGVYVDSDLKIGVVKATWPLRASYCSSAFLGQAEGNAIEALLVEMQRAIPNHAFLQVQSYCNDDLRVQVEVRGPENQSRLFDYPASDDCLGDGTVPTWLSSLVDRVRAHEDVVASCLETP